MILREGRVHDYGTPERIYTKPASVFVANLLGGANFLEGIVESDTHDSVLLRIRGGLNIRAPWAPLTHGEPVVIGVRKEHLKISYVAPDVENTIGGVIRNVRFLGRWREYVVRLINGDIVTGRQFTGSDNQQFRVGDSVIAAFQQRDTLIFAYPSRGLRKELEIS